MENIDDVQVVIKKVICGEYNNTMDLPDSKMDVDEDYITDYSKSVLWNREQASKLKQKYLKQKQKYDNKTKCLIEQFQKDLFLCIKQMYKFTDESIYFLIAESFEQEQSSGLLQVVYKTLELSETCYEFTKLNNVKVL